MIIGARSPAPDDSSRHPSGECARSVLPSADVSAGLLPQVQPTASSSFLRRHEPKVELPTGTAARKLKNNQKAILSRLAKEAYARAQAHHATEGLDETEWRHAESIKAAGVRISEAEQRHYNAIKGHFELLAGQAGKAFGTHLKESTNDLRIAHFKLDLELKTYGLGNEYAAAICRRKYRGLALAGATAKQIWAVIFDIRRSQTRKATFKRTVKAAVKSTTETDANPF